MYIRVKHSKLSNRAIIINIPTILIHLNNSRRRFTTDLSSHTQYKTLTLLRVPTANIWLICLATLLIIARTCMKNFQMRTISNQFRVWNNKQTKRVRAPCISRIWWLTNSPPRDKENKRLKYNNHISNQKLCSQDNLLKSLKYRWAIIRKKIFRMLREILKV